jgi:hypothetical protein
MNCTSKEKVPKTAISSGHRLLRPEKGARATKHVFKYLSCLCDPMGSSTEDAKRLVRELVRAQRFPNVIHQDALSEALRKDGYAEPLIEAVLTDVTQGALNQLSYDPEILVGLETGEIGGGVPFPLGFDRTGPAPICCFGLPQGGIKATLAVVYSYCPEREDVREFVKKYRCVSLRKCIQS